MISAKATFHFIGTGDPHMTKSSRGDLLPLSKLGNAIFWLVGRTADPCVVVDFENIKNAPDRNASRVGLPSSIVWPKNNLARFHQD